MMGKIICIYLLVINIITFLIYGLDKLKAKKEMWRISERVLIVLAMVGGSIGALLGMRVFHHKTQKWKFKIGVPVILGLQITLVIFIWLKMKGLV